MYLSAERASDAPHQPDGHPRWPNHEHTQRFSTLRYRDFLGRGACTVGLGPCRERGEEDPEVVLTALAAGINVLDTAPHFHGGAHERCIGEALRLAGVQGVCERESMIIATTIGVVPDLLHHDIRTLGFGRVKALVEERFIIPGIFGWSDLAEGRRCIAPGYLRHAIEQSLARTGSGYLDCVFVDSPEVHRRALDGAGFDRRMCSAFEALEEQCAAGRIRGYGISTSDAVDLERLLGLASSVAGSRARLCAVRAPFSLLRPQLQPLLADAAARGLYVLATACLDGGTPRYQLPDELDEVMGSRPDFAVAIAWVQSQPWVGTAVFGSRESRHVRQNVAAAGLPLLATVLPSNPRGERT